MCLQITFAYISPATFQTVLVERETNMRDLDTIYGVLTAFSVQTGLPTIGSVDPNGSITVEIRNNHPNYATGRCVDYIASILDNLSITDGTSLTQR